MSIFRLTINSKGHAFLFRVFLSFLLLLFTASYVGASNYANEHFLPPVYNSQGGNDVAEKVVIHLTTMEDSAFTVTLQSHAVSPAWVTYATRTISKDSPATVVFNCNGTGDCGYITAMSNGSSDTYTGMRATASSPFYVNVDVLAGSQAGSYSSKGSLSVGKRFLSAHYEAEAEDLGKFGDFISVMATETGTTTVTFTKNNNNWSPSVTSVSLQQGDSYILSNDTQNDSNIGTLITSDQNIAVVSGGLSVAAPAVVLAVTWA